MLDFRFVADNLDYVQKKLSARSGKYDLSAVKSLVEERRAIIVKSEGLKRDKNAASAKIAELKRQKLDAAEMIAAMREAGEQIKTLDARLQEIEDELSELMLTLPNLPDDSVPVGADDTENALVRKFSEPTCFSFAPKAHWDIGTQLGILNFDEAAKITGARFTVYHGLGARLERAVINYMLDSHRKRGYEEVLPPFIVNRDSMIGTGQLPKFEEDMYKLEGLPYYLVPTAEVPVTNLYRNEIIPSEKLPVRYCAYTACFRGEAGSSGRDTRGVIRQHQFNKVELVNFTKETESWQALEDLTHSAELILQGLKLPYRVMCLSTGDLGFGSAKTYDLEVWMPSYERYVEISSCSNYIDFQARRANIKYRDENGKLKLCHTLNGSGLAVGRTVAAILENYQNEDGTVTVPEVLVPYLGEELIR